MIFLYSRKSQLFLLALWLVGMAVLYTQTTGERPHWSTRASEQSSPNEQPVRIGQEPAAPAATPVPVQSALSEADPTLNRCLAWRVKQNAGAVVVDLDYIAARENGFSIEKVIGYHLRDAPVYVVAFGEPWISEIRDPSILGTIPQVAGLNVIISPQLRQLRLVVHTQSMHVARGAKFHVSPADTGMRVEIQLPR